MSDPDHLAKFFEGVAAWNEWRSRNIDVVPDLTGAYLADGAAFARSDTDEALNLRYSLLRGADLTGAPLDGADLTGTDLREADLSEASLVGADLSFANLANARLEQTDFRDAQLSGALLSGARLQLAENVTQAQLESADGDELTSLPPGLVIPETWRFAFAPLPEDDILPENGDEWLPATPYTLLEIGPEAKTEEIRAAYLKLAKKYHPDLNPSDAEAEQQFKRINEAYRLLVKTRTVRVPPKRKRATASWTAASGLFLLALVIPAGVFLWMERATILEGVERAIGPSAAPAPRKVAALIEANGASDAGGAAPAAKPDPDAVASVAAEPGKKAIALVTTAATLPSPSQEAVAEDPEPAPDGDAALEAGGEDSQQANAPHAPEEAAIQAASDAPPAMRAGGQRVGEPWIEAWDALRDSDDLIALQSFIALYPHKPQSDEARERYARLIEGMSDRNVLQALIGQAAADSTERTLASRRLAALIDEERRAMESQAWRKAETEATADAIRAFIVSHPESADAPEAKRKLAALEAGSAKKNQEKEDAAWAMAEQSGKQPALEAFLKAYPDGGHAGKAKAVLEELAAKKPGSKQDEEAWAKAKAQNTRQAYQGYLKAYPKGPHAEAARQKLKTAETGKKDADNATASAEPEKRPARTGSDGGARWPF